MMKTYAHGSMCPLIAHESMEKFLRALGISGQLIKREISKSQHRKQKLMARDEINIPLDVINHFDVSPLYRGPEVEQIFLDDNLLAVHKPSGIHTVSQRYSDSATLSAWLRMQHPHLYQDMRQSKDRGILNRLDFQTTGVCLIARTQPFFEQVRSQFDLAVNSKTYLAIICGQPNWETLELSLSMKSTGAAGEKVIVDKTSSATINTWSSVKILKFLSEDNLSLAQIQIRSGHRHQIRVACAHAGFPLWGDELYGNAQNTSSFFLHAWKYQLNLPGIDYQITAPLPVSWKQWGIEVF